MPRLIALILFVSWVLADPAVAAGAAAESAAGLLDGQQYKGVTGEEGAGADHEDTIIFSDGKFRSLDCEGWGFGPAAYTADKIGDRYHFTATLSSRDRGTLEWKGVISGDTATATFRWLHERWYWSIDRRYWFEGTRHASR